MKAITLPSSVSLSLFIGIISEQKVMKKNMFLPNIYAL
jgi:hypothetical protein